MMWILSNSLLLTLWCVCVWVKSFYNLTQFMLVLLLPFLVSILSFLRERERVDERTRESTWGTSQHDVDVEWCDRLVMNNLQLEICSWVLRVSVGGERKKYLVYKTGENCLFYVENVVSSSSSVLMELFFSFRTYTKWPAARESRAVLSSENCQSNLHQEFYTFRTNLIGLPCALSRHVVDQPSRRALFKNS